VESLESCRLCKAPHHGIGKRDGASVEKGAVLLLNSKDFGRELLDE